MEVSRLHHHAILIFQKIVQWNNLDLENIKVHYDQINESEIKGPFCDSNMLFFKT